MFFLEFYRNFLFKLCNYFVRNGSSILKTSDLHDRALMCLKQMNVELQRLSLKNDIQSKVRSDLDQQQREYFLHQQLKTIQEELGGVSYDEEINEMRLRSKNKKWNKEINDHFLKELSKLQRMNPQVAEYSIQRNYLDLYLDLPWNKFSVDNFDLKRAQKILNRDHYGLDEVKKRILEGKFKLSCILAADFIPNVILELPFHAILHSSLLMVSINSS